MHPPITFILFFSILTSLLYLIRATLNLSLPYQHPYPEVVVQQVQRLNKSFFFFFQCRDFNVLHYEF
ncbi:hypothetical protein Hanom_Chr06g00567581 [Helianthus anomalus]